MSPSILCKDSKPNALELVVFEFNCENTRVGKYECRSVPVILGFYNDVTEKHQKIQNFSLTEAESKKICLPVLMPQ